MKSLSLLLLGLFTLALGACATAANQRHLYNPAKPEGPATKRLHKLMYYPMQAHGAPSHNNP